MSLTFIETKVFMRKRRKLLSDRDFERFCEDLGEAPSFGDVIRGTGGLRKIRRAAKGRGKSGGVRVIYFWAVNIELIVLLDIYAKNVKDDLSHDELKRLFRAKSDILDTK